MFRPRASLLIFLLAFAPTIWADSIEVTTFADENDTGSTQGSGCSLREALHYMTLPIKPEEDEDSTTPPATPAPTGPFRDDGWGGCKLPKDGKPSAGGDVIVLPHEINGVKGVYQLAPALGSLNVKVSVTINGKENVRAKFAHIKAAANQRIFLIDDGSEFSLTRIGVSLSQLKLEGNGQVLAPANTCHFTRNSSAEKAPVDGGDNSATWPKPTDAGGGGLILSCGENVTISKAILKNGEVDTRGGAIRVTHAALLSVSSTEFWGNRAAVGGAVLFLSVDGVVISTTTPAPPDGSTTPQNPVPVYSKSGLLLSTSLLTGNGADGSVGALIGFEGAPGVLAKPELVAVITTTTISGNNGLAIYGGKGLAVDNSTIVENTAGGIDFSAVGFSSENDALEVYNSVIAGNGPSKDGSQDCLNAISDAALNGKRTVRFNFFQNTGSCANAFSSSAPYKNSFGLPSNVMALMASDADCKARVGGNQGLLCPLAENGGDTLTHRPRLPVINDNADANFSASVLALMGDDVSCEASDQRGEQKREQGCDRGSLQLKVNATAKPIITTSTGKATALFAVDTKTEDDKDLPGYVALLGDIELLPATECGQVGVPFVAGRVLDGCLQLDVQGNLVMLDGKSPGKGRVSVGSFNDAKGVSRANSVIYTPHSAFHGTDEFSFRVATTLSRYSDRDISPTTGQFAVVSVLVRGQPERGISSSSAGALAWKELMLLGASLFALLAYRRRQYV